MTETRRYRRRLRDRKAAKINPSDVTMPTRGPDRHDRRTKGFDPTPDEVFAERARRHAICHDSITAAAMGDPLPGYRALDQRTQPAD